MKKLSRSNVARWKEDRGDYVASIRRHRIRRLLHYTPVDNLESILESGEILSRRQQGLRGLSPVTVHGWGQKWKPLEDYICLCFEPPLGLLKREKRPMAVLVIRPEVIAFRHSLYCPMNSARSWIAPDEVLSRCDLEAFEDLFATPEGPQLKNRESEILVRGSLGLAAVRYVVLPDPGVYRSLRRLRYKCLWRGMARGRKLPRWKVDREGILFL